MEADLDAIPSEPGAPRDLMAPERALRAPALLREFNHAGVLISADIHVAVALGRLVGVTDEQVLLAVAMAVRAPRLGHVFTDLASAEATVAVESARAPLPWPDPIGWVARVRDSEQLVAAADQQQRPLRLEGTHLYLERYWLQERTLAEALRTLADLPPHQLELNDLHQGITRLFGDPADTLARAACACVALRGLTVIAGGPGTGKTTTVARAAALIFELEQIAQERGEPSPASTPLMALCAPTGKAATRLQEAVKEESARLDISDPARAQLHGLRAGTIHKLLGWRGSLGSGGFVHGADNRLPHDVVIVDETSMVSLSLMTRLVSAIRPDARLVLVGDPDQLAAVEAGAVLRDIVGPATDGVSFSPGMCALVTRATGDEQPPAAAQRWFGDGVIRLRRGHRFGAEIGALAQAIRHGDADGAVTALRDGGEQISWIGDGDSLDLLQRAAVAAYTAVIDAARKGDAAAALASLGTFRLLCAHRRGPYGVSHWTSEVEQWLGGIVQSASPGTRHYVGQPLLITENDHELQLNNGDVGVVVNADEGERASAVFERDGVPFAIAPSRLASVEPLYAMTIHKSQGSQFDVTAVVLPEPDSAILTRELLYTAVTRARHQLIVVGGEESIRAAVARPVARATGLQERLWVSSRD